MQTYATTVLLITALLLPVLVFLLFRPPSPSRAVLAIAIAVVASWAFNVACIFALGAMDPAAATTEKSENLDIAVTYGWACPLVLAAITWALWHVATRRGRAGINAGSA